MITRRDFLKTSAAVAALSVLPAGLSASAAPKEKAIGLQLYSVRDDLQKDFDGTIRKVIEIGYKRLEAAGYRNGKFYGKSPSEIKKYLSDLGASMTGSHTGSGLLPMGDTKGWDFWKQNAADTAEAGCKWIVQAGYPSGDIKTIEDVKRLADQFNKVGDIAKSNGLRFAFHNHIDEFKLLEGKIPFDVLLDYTEDSLVTFQLDTAQMVHGGFKCHEYVKKYPGRFANWHIKDASLDGDGSTEMGKGKVDFKSLFAVAKKAGLEDYYVEQEKYNMSPLEAIKYDYDFIMKANYVKW